METPAFQSLLFHCWPAWKLLRLAHKCIHWPLDKFHQLYHFLTANSSRAMDRKDSLTTFKATPKSMFQESRMMPKKNFLFPSLLGLCINWQPQSWHGPTLFPQSFELLMQLAMHRGKFGQDKVFTKPVLWLYRSPAVTFKAVCSLLLALLRYRPAECARLHAHFQACIRQMLEMQVADFNESRYAESICSSAKELGSLYTGIGADQVLSYTLCQILG